MEKKSGLQSLSGILLLFVVAHFCHHLLPSLVVPLLPFIRNDFSLNYAQSGLLVSAFTLSYGIGQLPAGWLTDHLGPRKMITVAVSGVALAGLMVGLSTSFFLMTLFLILMGIAGGGYHPSAPPLISRSIKPQSRGLALGFHFVGGSACFFLTPLLIAMIVPVWGWRNTFIGFAIPTVIFGIILYFFLKPMDVSAEKSEMSVDAGDNENTLTADLKKMAVFLILTMSTFGIFTSCMAFIPLFMVDHFKIQEETAAAYLSIVYSAGFWAAPLGGYLSDRFGSRPVLLMICFSFGPIVFLMNLVPYGWAFGGLLLFFGMFAMMRMPVSELFILNQTSERHRSTILGIYFFACTEGGAILVPALGFCIDKFGFYNAFAGTGILLTAITLLCAFFLKESKYTP